ncbi:MAG: hypothetical protein EG828_09995 [Deltaproteobacteria bacterium]|nr:hypothetical protein [Deltaproteobacteria bacterium]
MKRILCCLALAAVLPVTPAFASNVDFNIGINVGTRPTVVAPVPPPPVYHEPAVVYQEPPLFIEPPELGFHVAVGISQDIFFVGNSYFRYHNNVWYEAPYYGAPWVVTRYSALPWKLRRYPYKKVRYYRDAGYRNYRQGRDGYWERHHFRPKHEVKHEWKRSRNGDGDARRYAGREDRDRSGHGGRHRE